jgi:hypothetical protein
MKTLFPHLVVIVLALVWFNSSSGQFPCNPSDSVASCCGADSGYLGYSWDLGFCDTFNVVPWPGTDTCFISCWMEVCDTICINNPGEKFPCFLYVPLLVTHDSNTFYAGLPGPEPDSIWVQDSIFGFVVPLAWTHTNPTAYCSLSTYWNQNAMSYYDPRFPRSIWRHFHPGQVDSNRMAVLAAQLQGLEWSTIVLSMTSDSSWYHFEGDSVFTPPHVWLALIPSNPTNRRWWEGERTLLATLTFRIEDSMHVCIDSTWWPATNHLKFTRYDVRSYVPRDNLPVCITVPPRIDVTSPNGGENWCVGKTHEITWTHESFSGSLVKIEYSTGGGTNWFSIEDSTQNDGSYDWTIPQTPSDRCLVRVSDAEDGDPYDRSDDLFTVFLAGDANSDGHIHIADVMYLINYLFVGGSPPDPLWLGDCNRDQAVDVTDLMYLMNYLFIEGPPPQCP